MKLIEHEGPKALKGKVYVLTKGGGKKKPETTRRYNSGKRRPGTV